MAVAAAPPQNFKGRPKTALKNPFTLITLQLLQTTNPFHISSKTPAVSTILQPDKDTREIGDLAVWSVTTAKPGNGMRERQHFHPPVALHSNTHICPAPHPAHHTTTKISPYPLSLFNQSIIALIVNLIFLCAQVWIC